VASIDLSERDVERMAREARQNEAADRRRKELADARSAADAKIHQAEALLRAVDVKVPAGDRSAIDRLIRELKVAKESGDGARIRQLAGHLQQVYARAASWSRGQNASSG